MADSPSDFFAAAQPAIAAAASHADDVDADARFPIEAVTALRAAGLFSCSLPPELGGRGATVEELARIARRLGAACSSAGMVFAMHHSQALSLARHVPADQGPLATVVRGFAASEALLASATTEISTGGDVTRSTCAVDISGDDLRLTKKAPVVSYAQFADAILVTARREPAAQPTDQVVVVAPIADVTLQQTSTWDTLGFRGTCSPGFQLTIDTAAQNVVQAPYSTVSAQTMLPASHSLWASVWLGIADAAVSKARAETRSAQRRFTGDGVTPLAQKFADLVTIHQEFETYVLSEVGRFGALIAAEGESTVGFALAMNNLKINSSASVVEVVVTALRLCGINGYRLGHPGSMGRLLRDSFGPQLMVSNDRIRANNAALALAHREK